VIREPLLLGITKEQKYPIMRSKKARKIGTKSIIPRTEQRTSEVERLKQTQSSVTPHRIDVTSPSA
jgi:hypothetical protein